MVRFLMFEMDDWESLFRNDGTNIVRLFNHHRMEAGSLLKEVSTYHPFEYRSFFYDGDDAVIGEMWGDHKDEYKGREYWEIWDVPNTMDQTLFDYMWEKAYVWV